MARSGKTLDELIDEVYAIVGPFSYDRDDLHISEALKQEVLEKCRSNAFDRFGDLEVRSVETIDGFKFHFDDEQWLMIRGQRHRAGAALLCGEPHAGRCQEDPRRLSQGHRGLTYCFTTRASFSTCPSLPSTCIV